MAGAICTAEQAVDWLTIVPTLVNCEILQMVCEDQDQVSINAFPIVLDGYCLSDSSLSPASMVSLKKHSEKGETYWADSIFQV